MQPRLCPEVLHSAIPRPTDHKVKTRREPANGELVKRVDRIPCLETMLECL